MHHLGIEIDVFSASQVQLAVLDICNAQIELPTIRIAWHVHRAVIRRNSEHPAHWDDRPPQP